MSKKTKPSKSVAKSDPLAALQKSSNSIATAFHLIAQAQYPGSQADAVCATLKFLDDLHAETVKELETMMPTEEPAKVPAKVPAAAESV
jgi:hypothetical protein